MTDVVAASDAVAAGDAGATVSLSLLLKQAEHELRCQLQPALERADLTLEHWQIMAVLLTRPGLRMSEIAEAAVVPAATLTRHMDRLVERALVVRRIDPGDRRRVVAALSPRGAELATALREQERATEAAVAERLGRSLVAQA